MATGDLNEYKIQELMAAVCPLTCLEWGRNCDFGRRHRVSAWCTNWWKLEGRYTAKAERG